MGILKVDDMESYILGYNSKYAIPIPGVLHLTDETIEEVYSDFLGAPGRYVSPGVIILKDEECLTCSQSVRSHAGVAPPFSKSYAHISCLDTRVRVDALWSLDTFNATASISQSPIYRQIPVSNRFYEALVKNLVTIYSLITGKAVAPDHVTQNSNLPIIGAPWDF